MKIGKLKAILNAADPNLSVRFDFCNTVPTTVDSWRGVYAEPAIGWSHNHETVTVASLLDELNKATDGREYYGWKGGEYSYNDSHTLHVDNPGKYSCTDITHVSVDWCVTLHTERVE